MENTDRGVQGRTDETEIAEPVATCLEFPEEMAHVHFGLRKLAIDADVPLDELVEGLRRRVAPRRIV